MINYFILSHDITLCKKYQHLIDSLKYLIVGANNTININNNYIICNQLKNHIEQYPFLCSYTGWYAVAKNNLFNSHVVSLLEYDTIISHLFETYNKNICSQQLNNNYIIAYNKTLTNHYVFYKSTPWLEIALKRVYDIDLVDFVRSYSKSYPLWPTTTNITMPVEVLIGFIEWFHPMARIFKQHPLGAYVHERALFIYCVLNNIKIIYAPSHLLTHQQAQSHKINDVYGSFLATKDTHILDNSMLEEYDKVYTKSLHDCLVFLLNNPSGEECTA